MLAEVGPQQDAHPLEDPIAHAVAVHAVEFREVVDVNQHHRHPVLEALGAMALLQQHRVEQRARVQRRQRILDRKPLRHVQAAGGPRRQQVERGAADDLRRLRPGLGVGSDPPVLRQLVDGRVHCDVDEHEHVVGCELALGDDRGKLAHAGRARVDAVVENRVAQQLDHRLAKPHAVVRIEPSRAGAQGERRDGIGDDHLGLVL